jgi:hypothetical protein
MGFARYDEAAILMSFEELRAVGEDAGADLIERFPPPRVSVRLQNPAAARRQSTSLRQRRQYRFIWPQVINETLFPDDLGILAVTAPLADGELKHY